MRCVDEVDVGIQDGQVFLHAFDGGEAALGARVAADDGLRARLVVPQVVVRKIGGVLPVQDRGTFLQGYLPGTTETVNANRVGVANKTLTLAGTW